MSNVSFHFAGVDEFERAIDEIVAKGDAALATFVAQGGALIEAAAKERAPVKTGTLRRSIGVWSITGDALGMWSSRTYPTTVYSRRIELGFHGNDSLGRHYSQSGQPYLTPGLDDAKSRLSPLFESTVRKALEV